MSSCNLKGTSFFTASATFAFFQRANLEGQ